MVRKSIHNRLKKVGLNTIEQIINGWSDGRVMGVLGEKSMYDLADDLLDGGHVDKAWHRKWKYRHVGYSKTPPKGVS